MRTFKKCNELLFPHMEIDSCKTTTAGFNDVFTAVQRSCVCVCVSMVRVRPSTGCLTLSKLAPVILPPLGRPLAYLFRALPGARPWAHLQSSTSRPCKDTASTALHRPFDPSTPPPQRLRIWGAKVAVGFKPCRFAWPDSLIRTDPLFFYPYSLIGFFIIAVILPFLLPLMLITS